jgi:hypothetical protein
MQDEEEKGSYSQRHWVPPVYKFPKLSDADQELLRKRQRSGARVLALLLGAFVILLFFITIAKTSLNW